jgi:hypothetical protein
MACSTVRVEDGVRLAEDSLGVEVDGFVVGLVAVRSVASLLELGSILLALLLCKGLHNGFVDLGKLIADANSGSLRLRGRRGGLILGGFALGLLALATFLFAELGDSVVF